MLKATRRMFPQAALAVLATVTPFATLADEWDVLNFIIGHTITYDDNLFRVPPGTTPLLVPNGSTRNDVINTTFVGLNVNKLVSRQRFIIDARMDHSIFSEHGALDYDGRNAKGRWLWEVGNHWKGEVSVENVRRLSSFVDLQVRNTVDYRRYYGSARYEFHPEWSVVAGASRVDNTNSAPQQEPSDYSANAVEAGVQFNPTTGNQVAFKYRRTDGRYPNRQVVSSSFFDNSYTQDDVELTALWRVTGESRFDGRVGLTQRKHDQLSQRDFRGPTGRLTYDWNVTGKTLLNAALWREIGAADDTNASYVLSNGVSITPTYNATPKFQLQGKLQYVERDHRGDPGFLQFNTAQQQDKIKTGSVTATYLPLRSLQLSLTYQNEHRDSNFNSLDYVDNLTYASAQLTF